MKNSQLSLQAAAPYAPVSVLMLLANRDRFPLRALKFYDNDGARQKPSPRAVKIIPRNRHRRLSLATPPIQSGVYRCGFRDGAHPRGQIPDARRRENSLRHGVLGQKPAARVDLLHGMRSNRRRTGTGGLYGAVLPNAWMLNTQPGGDCGGSDAPPASASCQNSQHLRYANRIEGRMAQIVGPQDRKQMRVRYYGLNHFGWWTSIEDLNGNDLMPKLREYVAKHGYVPPSKMRIPKRAGTILRQSQRIYTDPDTRYHAKHLSEVLLFPIHAWSRTPTRSWTRANEVMDHREKHVFSSCRAIIVGNPLPGS